MNISDKEKRIRLCNIIRECVMEEIDHLRSIADNSGMVQATESTEALERLITAVAIKNGDYIAPRFDFFRPDRHAIHAMELLTLDSMMNARIPTWIPGTRADFDHGEYNPGTPARFGNNLSLLQALNISSSNLFNRPPVSILSGTFIKYDGGGSWGPFFGRTDALAKVQETLSNKVTDNIFRENLEQITILNRDTHSRKINAIELCDKLVSFNFHNLEERYDFGSVEINTLVPASIFSRLPTLSVYNAVMLAAVAHHERLLKYFIEEKQADLTIKGGIFRDVSILDCAKRGEELYRPNPEIIEYLERKMYGYSPLEQEELKNKKTPGPENETSDSAMQAMIRSRASLLDDSTKRPKISRALYLEDYLEQSQGLRK